MVKLLDVLERSGLKLVVMCVVVDCGNFVSSTSSFDSFDFSFMFSRSKRLMWNDEGIMYLFLDFWGLINMKCGK